MLLLSCFLLLAQFFYNEFVLEFIFHITGTLKCLSSLAACFYWGGRVVGESCQTQHKWGLLAMLLQGVQYVRARNTPREESFKLQVWL